jgi:hypothetical protein
VASARSVDLAFACFTHFVCFAQDVDDFCWEKGNNVNSRVIRQNRKSAPSRRKAALDCSPSLQDSFWKEERQAAPRLCSNTLIHNAARKRRELAQPSSSLSSVPRETRGASTSTARTARVIPGNSPAATANSYAVASSTAFQEEPSSS